MCDDGGRVVSNQTLGCEDEGGRVVSNQTRVMKGEGL